MKPPKVDILIRGWENLPLTRRLLASIEHNTEYDYQVIYVDGGSGVYHFSRLLNDFPWATLVRLTENRGSCRNINIGLAHALMSPAPYILILDNDTEIPDGDHEWLARFVGYMEDGVGAAGAVSNYVSGYQNIEALPDTYKRDWKDETGEGFKDMPDMPVLVSFALLLNKEAVRQAGFFDERFEPGNLEDYDYTLRLRAHGWRCVLAPSVWIHHKGSQTFSLMGHQQLLERNTAKLIEKWGADKLEALGMKIVAPAVEQEAVPA